MSAYSVAVVASSGCGHIAPSVDVDAAAGCGSVALSVGAELWMAAAGACEQLADMA